MSETTHGLEDPVLEDPTTHFQAIIDSSSTGDSDLHLQQIAEAGLLALDTPPPRPESQQLAEITAQQVDGVYNPPEERSLLLPVNQLPPETFESIFQECLWLMRLDTTKAGKVYKYGTGVHHKVLLSLALVSKRWHAIVFGTPSLWALVSLTVPTTLVDKGLDLSGSHLLDIYCETQQYSTSNGAVKASLLQFIKAVTPHLGRCRLLRLAFDGVWFPETLPLLSSPNEAIEALEMCQYQLPEQPYYHHITFPSTPFQRQAPKLARIEILGISVGWTSLAGFPALRTLELCNLTIRTSSMESGLKNCLALRVLEVHNAPLDVDVPESDPLFDLPNLQRLVCTHITSNGAAPMNPLLTSRIRSLRSLESVHLGIDFRGLRDNEAYFQANFAHLSSDFSRILGSATCLHIDSEEHTSLHNTAGSLRLRFPNNMPHFLWRFFGDIVYENEFSGNVYLSVRNHSLRYISEDSQGWSHLNVSRLTLGDKQRAGTPLGTVSKGLMSLGTFLEDPHHWSTLRCIRLDFDEIKLDWLTACLKKRYSGTHDISVQPQRINIEIKCWENGADGLEELKAMQGVDSLIVELRSRDALSRPWDDEAEPTKFEWDL